MSLQLSNVTILCVDDEPSLREVYRDTFSKTQKEDASDMLSEFGFEDAAESASTSSSSSSYEIDYEVLIAASGEEAEELVKQRQAAGLPPITVGFFDMKMPGGIDGYETMYRLRKLDPRMLCVVVTAFTDRANTSVQDLFEDAQDELLFFKKPFTPEALIQAALNMVSSWNRKRQIESYEAGIRQILEATPETYAAAQDLNELAKTSLKMIYQLTKQPNTLIHLTRDNENACLTSGKFSQLNADQVQKALSTATKANGYFEIGCEDTTFGKFYTELDPKNVTMISQQLLQMYSAQVCQILLSSSYQTELVKKNTEVVTDQLTGLYNRKFVEQQLMKQFNEVDQESIEVTLVMVDLDYFKSVNDDYGHLVGDAVLRQIGQLIRRQVRSNDIIQRVDSEGSMYAVRYGGEEFLLILCGVTAATAVKISERLRRVIEAHTFTHENITLRRTASLGVSTSKFTPAQHQPESFIEKLLHKADEALYAAKENGRNQVQISM